MRASACSALVAAVMLSGCGAGTGAVASGELDCPGDVEVIEGSVAEDAKGASDPATEAEQALHSMMPSVEFVAVRRVGSAEVGDEQTWHAIDGRGYAVAQVSVLEMNDSFVAATLSACRP